MSARSEFRSNAKPQRFTMNAPQYVVPRPQAATWPRRLTWALLGVGMILGAFSTVAFIVGAALTLAGAK